MRTKRFTTSILVILLVLCELITVSTQTAFGLSATNAPDDAVIIGFIDSGIATYNIDESHILPGKNYVFEGKNTIDRIGHGTKTAGMVLGSSDGNVKGVFPDAYLVPLVITDAYPGGNVKTVGIAELTEAIYDAVDVFGCDVINMSLGTTTDDPRLKAAVDYAYEKGVTVVASVSNRPQDRSKYYPACYDSVIAVGAADGVRVASFSQTENADFFYQGKGVKVVSNKKTKTGKIKTDSGTSYACACVSGLCASFIKENRSLTPDQIRSKLSEMSVLSGPYRIILNKPSRTLTKNRIDEIFVILKQQRLSAARHSA